jgi:hypothetical protein
MECLDADSESGRPHRRVGAATVTPYNRPHPVSPRVVWSVVAAATYSLRVFSDDLGFEPAEVDVAGPRTEVTMRWA